MKKLSFLPILVFFIFFTCSNDDIKTEDELSISATIINNQKFKKGFTVLTDDFNYLNTIDLLQFAKIQKVVDVFEVIESKSNYDYAFVFDDKELVYAEFNEITNEIIITDFISKQSFKFKRIPNNDGVIKVLDLNSGYYLGDQVNRLPAAGSGAAGCSGTLMLCSAGCVLATGAIAVSDEPLPLMDILAAATYIICNAHCASSYDYCTNSCDCN